MAQQVMETEGLDTKSWLKSHNLGHLFDKFDEAAFTIEDLVTCDKQSVKYVNLSSFLVIKHYVDILNLLDKGIYANNLDFKLQIELN